jgi:hypothetical protein
MFTYLSDRDDFLDLLGDIKTKLNEGLDYISQFEKLTSREGQIKIIYHEGKEYGIEIYAPHLIPGALSFEWVDSNDFRTSFKKCLKDLTLWVQIEKEAPRNSLNNLDLYS